ncbi:DUF5994 family protein [Mycobacterium sp. HUMS_1102779]|uniref:DUF5994 family protein n=1 Tax=Mycobacterium sp. HUMS_1102779 TaxID=3383487 RepID=UPI003899D3E4
MTGDARVTLMPKRPASEHFDGAWWPRSRHLVEELPGLVASVSDRLGPVVLVGYRRNGWDETPPLVDVGGQTVELLGFTSDEPASVVLIGEDGRHLTLHVVRLDAGDDVARRAMEAHAGAGAAPCPPAGSTATRSLADIAEKLAQHEGGDAQRAAEIRRWTEEATQQFVDAPLQTFVPILVEHIVRNRMLESRRDRAAESR